MYFEIYRNGKLIKRGTRILGDLSWDNELMYTPDLTLELPIEYLNFLSTREEVKVFANDKCFWGIVSDKVEVNKEDETIEVNLKHIVSEWELRQISVNNAVKEKKLNIIFKGSTIETQNDISVSANDFEMLKTEVGEMTNAQYIQRAGAAAWRENGEVLTISSVDTSAIQDQTGSYDVIFTSNGVSVTVKAEVKEEDADTGDPDVEPSIIDQLADIFTDTNFAYPGWYLNFSNKAKNTTIDYVYSRQNKLDALTKTMELTPDLFWRVRFQNQKVLDISEFGEQKPYVISMKPSGTHNIRMISELRITHEFSNVVNLATVYSEKSDTGMSSMTLREVYNDPSLQLNGFPVVILRSNVNNERDYRRYTTQYPKLAPNNELEYAVIDEESVALEGGVVIEGTYAFNDLAPFTPETDEDGNTKEITDADRIKAAQTAYHATIKKLKQARRTFKIEVDTEQIPTDLMVGDKVILRYDNKLYILAECSNYEKKILSYDEWFYVTHIEYNIDENGLETDTLTLEKYLKIDRDTDNS